jgi:hypothetical protein
MRAPRLARFRNNVLPTDRMAVSTRKENQILRLAPSTVPCVQVNRLQIDFCRHSSAADRRGFGVPQLGREDFIAP